jgi:hypothetical protein
MVVVYAVHHNFARIYETLRVALQRYADWTEHDHVWSLEEGAMMAEGYIPKSKPPLTRKEFQPEGIYRLFLPVWGIPDVCDNRP